MTPDVRWRLLTFVLLLLLAACEGKEPLYQEQAYVLGTLVDISVYGEDEALARQAVGEAMREFQQLNDMLHPWRTSEVNDLNAAVARGESLAVSSELAAMLQDATQLSRQSRGLFNPAIGGLVKLWGFHADEFKPGVPQKKEVGRWVQSNPQMTDIAFLFDPPKERRGERGKIALTHSGGRPGGEKAGILVSSRNKAVQLDLGGYAKGYALDRAATSLRERGIRNALINIGGNVLAIGKHGSRPWRIGIQHPRKSGALAALDLHDGEAIGTSGDYQRYFIVENVRYCHLIDPHSGYPMQGVQAVTVLTRGAHAGVLSDVASKPLFIAGVKDWREAAAQMGLAEAMLVDGQGNVHLTSAMQKRLEFTDRNIRPFIEP